MNFIDVTVTRTVAASPHDVYDAWIDPKCPASPWSEADSERTILDAKVDGFFYWLVHHAGKTWPHYGRFTDLERGARVEYTWMSPSTDGYESVVHVAFVAEAAGTKVTLTHTGLPDNEDGRGHERGWNIMLDDVVEHFAKVAA